MGERKINPVLKQVLELGPTLIFFVVYMRIKDETYVFGASEYSGFIVAALFMVPLFFASIAALWWLTGTLSRMQVFLVLMVVFFGGLTAWFNDERFFKMKTSIVYGCLAGLLALGLWRGKSLLQWIMSDTLPMEPEGWMILTRRLAVMFAALALANEVIWRTQSTELWVKLETFAMPVALMVFLGVQFTLLGRYMIEPPEDKS